MRKSAFAILVLVLSVLLIIPAFSVTAKEGIPWFGLIGYLLTGGPPDGDNHGPYAIFSASPTSGDAPLTVEFNATNSENPGGEIESYRWDFGDGYTRSGEITTHTYEKAGTYTAGLTVTGDSGLEDQSTRTITVNEPSGPSVTEIEEALEAYIDASAVITVGSGWGNALLLGTTTTDSGQTFDVWITVRHLYQGEDYNYEIVDPNGYTHDVLYAGYTERFFVCFTEETNITSFLELSTQGLLPWNEIEKGKILYNVAWEMNQEEDFYQHFNHGDVIEVFSSNENNSLTYEVTSEHGYSGSGVFYYEDADGNGRATSSEFWYMG